MASSEGFRSNEFGFSVFLVLLVGLVVGLALTYSATSQLIPLIVGVPTLLILLLVALSNVSPRVERITDRFETALFSFESDLVEEEADEFKPGGVRRGIAWLLALSVGYYLFGFVAATPVFVYAYLRLEGGHPRKQSLVLAVGTTLFLVGLFEVLLETWLYPGVLVELLEPFIFG